MSQKLQTLSEQLSTQSSQLQAKDGVLKKLHYQVDRLTFQFHKQPREVWMDGYNEDLGHFDDKLQQAKNESYKWGWMNALTVMKVDQNNQLWDWYVPGLLELDNPPFKLDVN